MSQARTGVFGREARNKVSEIWASIDGIDTNTQFVGNMLAKASLTAQFLKSLSHPARLVLLCRLAEGPATVGEMEATLNLPQAEVSKQLARLRAKGLVTAKQDGRHMICAVADDRAVRIMRLLHDEFCR